MEIRYPNYYKKFQCVAGACPDTCCAGWEIPVDAASEKRYKEAWKTLKNRAFAGKLKKYIKGGRILSEGVTCPFLDAQGLCEMYKELGPEALCHTCARHPRHMEDYGNLHEMVLLLSCPEVARLVLEENDGGFYVRAIPERTGNVDGIDEKLLQLLLQMRELIWKISKDGSLPMEVRMLFSVALAHDVQRRIQKEAYGEAAAVLARYRAPGAVERFMKQWTAVGEPEEDREKQQSREKQRSRGKQQSREKQQGRDKQQCPEKRESRTERFLLMSDFMEELAGLETVCGDWPNMLERCRRMLYHSRDSRAMYQERKEVFTEEENIKDSEHLFQYFVYSFLLSALYDGDALTKMKMAVLCTMAIEELYMASDSLELEERVNICHALARQIENSDKNRGALEQFLKTETFCARRIIDALISNPQDR